MWDGPALELSEADAFSFSAASSSNFFFLKRVSVMGQEESALEAILLAMLAQGRAPV